MKSFIRAHGLPLTTAFLIAIAFPTWSLSPVAWIALVPLYAYARRLDPKPAALAFLVAGWAAHAFVLRWLLVQVYWAGGWAIVGQLLLTLFFGLQWAVAGYVWRFTTRNASPIFAAVVFALVWATMEWAQNARFNVFGAPVALAYSQGANAYIRQWAAIGGVPLIGFFIALTGGLLASAVERDRWRLARAGGVVATVLLAHVCGGLFIGEANYDDAITVGMYQSDYPVEMKHDSEYTLEMVETAVRKSIVLAENVPLDLMIWPEALIMKQIESRDVRELLTQFVSATGTPLFSGASRSGGDPPRAYNSAYLVHRDGTIGASYDKIQLAPFGEYIPLAGALSFIPTVVPAIGQMGSGTTPVVFDVNGRTLGPLICFEVLFPTMSADLRAAGADFLAVITNLAWFGGSNAITHEFDIARMRAIETRLPLVHVSNTGITGIFDPYGRFEVIHSIVDRRGQYFLLEPSLDPRATIQHRLIGALPLPAAESPPVPWPPHHFAVIAPILFAVLVGIRWWRVEGAFRGPTAEVRDKQAQ